MIRRLVISMLTGMVRGYQLVVSPWFAPTCRYYPSCSQYAINAVQEHGPVKGLSLAGWRLLRCNPWSKGGVDHVPPSKSSQGPRPELLAQADLGAATAFDSSATADTGRTTPEAALPSWRTSHGSI